LNSDSFKNNPYETIDLPNEQAIYEIEFNDGTKDKFDSSKGVFLIENNEQIKTTIGEVYVEQLFVFTKTIVKKNLEKS
jgi:hypothetical protein